MVQSSHSSTVYDAGPVHVLYVPGPLCYRAGGDFIQWFRPDGSVSCVYPIAPSGTTRAYLQQPLVVTLAENSRTLDFAPVPPRWEVRGDLQNYSLPSTERNREVVLSPDTSRLIQAAESESGFLLMTRVETSAIIRCRWTFARIEYDGGPGNNFPFGLSLRCVTVGGPNWGNPDVHCNPSTYRPGGPVQGAIGPDWDVRPFCSLTPDGRIGDWTIIESAGGPGFPRLPL